MKDIPTANEMLAMLVSVAAIGAVVVYHRFFNQPSDKGD
jgi:hypothetical protein